MRILNYAIFTLFFIGQFSCHPFDNSQVPQVKISTSFPPVFSWEPGNAWRLRVFAGDTDLDRYGDDLMWEITGTGAGNTLQSPVTYGINPPGTGQDIPLKPLIPGNTYTLVILRMDPKASGGGFTRRSNDYLATETFRAP